MKKTRRGFLKAGASVGSLPILFSQPSVGKQKTTVPKHPNLPLEKLDGWTEVDSGKDESEKVSWNYVIYSDSSARKAVSEATNLNLPVCTFFAGTFRFTGLDAQTGSGISVSIPLGRGLGVSLPISYLRGALDFLGVPIPESIDKEVKDKFNAGLESTQQFDNIDQRLTGLPGNTSYHKAGYEVNTAGYEAHWSNKDGDGLAEDVSFEGMLSIETDETGRNFLAVGGMYPAGSRILTSGDDPTFSPQSRRNTLRELMRNTMLPK